MVDLAGFIGRSMPFRRNPFFSSLPSDALALIKTRLVLRDTVRDQVLCQGGHPPPFVVFLNDGLVSAVIETMDGRSAEVCIGGAGSIAGLAALLKGPYNCLTEIVQIEGSAFFGEASAIRELLRRSPELHDAIMQEALRFGMRAARVAGCNALHSAEQRLARWLLMVQDYIAMNPLPISQEFLADMLAITRPSVSSVVNALQKKGALTLARERVHIRDRKTLERCSCECYSVLSRIGGGARMRDCA